MEIISYRLTTPTARWLPAYTHHVPPAVVQQAVIGKDKLQKLFQSRALEVYIFFFFRDGGSGGKFEFMVLADPYSSLPCGDMYTFTFSFKDSFPALVLL